MVTSPYKWKILEQDDENNKEKKQRCFTALVYCSRDTKSQGTVSQKRRKSYIVRNSDVSTT